MSRSVHCGARLPLPSATRPLRQARLLTKREITVHGKGRKTRTVRIGYDAARSPDRCLGVRARHLLARRPELWLGATNP